MTRLALYGSLRRGQPAYRRLGLDRALRFAGPCEISGALHDFGDWPGLVAGDGHVAGELYEVVQRGALAKLDAYEACNPARPAKGLFIRREVTLVSPARMRAMVYVFNRDTGDAPLIESGDWLRHLKER